MKKETSARLCLPFVSIRPKVWMGKYQDHLVNDGVSSRMLNRKTNDMAKVSFLSSCQRGKFKETSDKQGTFAGFVRVLENLESQLNHYEKI